MPAVVGTCSSPDGTVEIPSDWRMVVESVPLKSLGTASNPTFEYNVVSNLSLHDIIAC
jgi:hypothetical protein